MKSNKKKLLEYNKRIRKSNYKRDKHKPLCNTCEYTNSLDQGGFNYRCVNCIHNDE